MPPDPPPSRRPAADGGDPSHDDHRSNDGGLSHDGAPPNDGNPSKDGTPPAEADEAVVEEWKAETTPFERVYRVLERTYDPQSAADVADRARVSPTTARKHLRTLADAGEAATAERDRTTLYRRSAAAVVTEHAAHLLAEHTTDELAAGIADMKATIREWREEYGVESPEEFARELDVADADEEHGAVLREWQTTQRNLALAEAALAIAEASSAGRVVGSAGTRPKSYERWRDDFPTG